MQYTLVDLLKAEHIATGMEAASPGEAVQELNRLLVQSGHAMPEFADDVLEREKAFPTGLPTQPVAVAIPHADPDHLLQSAIAIGTLKSPLPFGQMGTDGSVIVEARIIFLLAIKEREKQVEMIQQLMGVIQSGELLQRLVAAESPGEAYEIIRNR
jgi:PTS system galactitol-specific IIA component